MADERIKEEGLTNAYLLGKYEGEKEGYNKAIDECISILEKFTKGTTRESFNWVEIWHDLWVAFKQLKGNEE